MYWWLSGFSIDWIIDPYGLTLTIGILASFSAWTHGLFTSGLFNRKMRALAVKIANSGGAPQPE